MTTVQRTIRILLLAIVAIFVLLATGAAYLYFADDTGYFRERKGTLASVAIRVVDSSADVRKSWLTLTNTDGFLVNCGMLTPHDSSRRYPTIILLGGKTTGKHAVDYALGIDNVIIVAVDYPYEPRESYTFFEVLHDLPAVRTALIDMVPSVMLLTDYLQQRSDVDTTKLVLVGYSFGAPFVPAILANDRRADVAAMVYGGGDLYSMIRHNVRRYEGDAFSEFVGISGWILLRPLEPMRFADRIAPTPLVMINGLDDEQIPRANTELFYNAAGEPKNLTWLPSRHVNPDNVELTKLIVKTLVGELQRLNVLPPQSPSYR